MRMLHFYTLALAASLLLVGCSSKPRSTTPGAQTPVYPRLTANQAQAITIHALGLIGTPYVGAGNTPEVGFDCSGLIHYVYRSETGIAPPRTVALLHHFGQEVSASHLRSGDLVLFGSGVPSHAGIYVGDGYFVHAPSRGGLVRKESLHSSYWSKQKQRYRRL